MLNLYDPEINFAQLNLLDSHDTRRFITTAGNDFSALKLAWLFLFTYIGAPCIYYGDEIGLSGGPDPECRATFDWNYENWDYDEHGYAKSLISLRRSHPALRRGSYTRLISQGDVYAFARSVLDETIIVVINAGNSSSRVQIPTSPIGLKMVYEPIFGDSIDKTYQGDFLDIYIAARSGMILASASR